MKTAIVMCAFAALCVMQAAGANLNQVQIQAQKMKNEVNSVVNELQRAQRDTKWNFDRQINEPKLNGLREINNVVNPAINRIRADVDKAKGEGKNAEPCYETARLRLRDLSFEGHDTMDTCANTARTGVDADIANMRNLEQQGGRIKNDIDSAFINCYSSNIIQMQSCIALKLGSIRPALNAFQSTATSMKSDAQNTIRNAVNQARSCFSGPAQNIRNELPAINAAATNCINNA